MTKTVLQIENVEADEILNRLDRMESAISALSSPLQQPQNKNASTEYITRRDVAKLFKISLVTVDDWTRKGVLTAYKAGNRVYYKQTEVESALTKKGAIYE